MLNLYNFKMSNLDKRVFSSGKKEQMRELPDDRVFPFCPQQMILAQEYITVVVIPCGREDGKNGEDETPFEIKIRKKGKLLPSICQINLSSP